MVVLCVCWRRYSILRQSYILFNRLLSLHGLWAFSCRQILKRFWRYNAPQSPAGLIESAISIESLGFQVARGEGVFALCLIADVYMYFDSKSIMKKFLPPWRRSNDSDF